MSRPIDILKRYIYNVGPPNVMFVGLETLVTIVVRTIKP